MKNEPKNKALIRFEGVNTMKNKKLIGILILVIAGLAIALAAVIVSYNKKISELNSVTANEIVDEVTEANEEDAEAIVSENEDTEEIEEEVSSVASNSDAYPSLLSDTVTLKKTDIKANTKPYSVEPGLANVYNKDLYYFSDEEMKRLEDDLFYVSKPWGNYEFFEVYEMNRYDYESNFVTVDSLMHTYHLFFSHLLKSLEKKELSDLISDMSEKLLAESNNQYEALKGTEWESAAKRNVQFFAVGAVLQGGAVNAAFDVSDVVEAELTKIENADEIALCEITDDDEDYTQYKPRGYYDTDKDLQQYFKTMMWYGRIQFNTKSEDMIRSSILMNLALNNSGLEEWKDVYDITTFFVGKSDDLGYYDYYPLIANIYGDNIKTEDLIGNEKSFSRFCEEVKDLKLPEINSIPIKMGEDNVIQGFRLMGQRFTIDASVMQNLIYSRIDANSKGELRMLPDVLDVAAALGSDTAYQLLDEQGDMDYENYKKNLDEIRKELSTKTSDEALGTNLYGNWLNTLRPLLKEKGEGYPSFMQSEKWAKKDIETFAGSYTELKHDTVLYAKQVMAEMGDGEIPEYDDRGYVQPEPDVYSRFAFLADATRVGLEERGRIDKADAENLKKLSELADSLRVMAEKELTDEVLTDEEYDLIREYGGILEHFWYDVISADNDDDDINTEKYQAALCVDVATDPNGAVLEMATGMPCTIYVIVNVDGKIKIAKGAAYSFYQFTWPIDDRLTDSKWREMMSFEPGSDGFYNYDENSEKIQIPWWTKDYSRVHEW